MPPQYECSEAQRALTKGIPEWLAPSIWWAILVREGVKTFITTHMLMSYQKGGRGGGGGGGGG